MDLKECISFARENPLCSLATAEDNQPHVRTVRLDQADDTGFYFTLGMTKKMYRQLCKNPRIELCFFHPDQDSSQVKLAVQDSYKRLLVMRPARGSSPWSASRSNPCWLLFA